MNIDELNEEQLRDIKRAFTIFILKVIKHSAIDFVRKEKLYNSRIVSLNEYVNNEMSLSGFDDDIFYVEKNIDYRHLENLMTKKKHQNAVSKLSEREKQIIHLLYIEEREVDEVAKLLNISTKTVLNTKKKALNKLKNDMEGDL
jgi:RNA polymerase sigma factor (sigma-70 family)